MTEKQNAETLELADKLVTIFDRIGVSCDWRLSSEERQDIAKAAVALHALRAAAPSPHPRGEPENDELGLFDLGQSFLEEYERAVREGHLPDFMCAQSPVEVLWHLINEVEEAKRAAPPPAGADAVREALRLFLSHLRGESVMVADAYVIHIRRDDYKKISDAYFASAPTPQPQEKPTGDQT